jgi:hypothetical protein
MKSRLKKGEDMKKLDKVPTKTILKVVPDNKPASKRDDLAADSKILKGGNSQITGSKGSGQELKSSKSTNNLNQIKKILAGSKNPENVLKDLMEVTEVNKNINIADLNSKAIAAKKVTFKDDLGAKSVQLKGKAPVGGKAPSAAPAKGGKSTAPAKTNTAASRSKSPIGMKKGVSTNNLLSKGAAALAMNKTKSTNNLKVC